MKKSFFAIAVFFSVLILLVIFGSFLYYLYFNCTWIVAGAEAVLQPPFLFFEGIPSVLGVCAVFSLLPVLFFFIQHKLQNIITLVLWIVLCVFVFFVLLPVSFILPQKMLDFEAKHNITQVKYIKEYKNSILTPGYFRTLNSGEYYFTNVNAFRKNVSGVVIYQFAGQNSASRAEVFTNNSQIFDIISGASDPLIANTIILPKFLKQVIYEIQILSNAGKKAFTQLSTEFSPYALLTYLGFASICVAVLGLYAFTCFSSWRLLNVLLLPVCYVFILHYNFLLTDGLLASSLKRLHDILPLQMPLWLSMLLCNGIIFVILFIFGIVGIIRKKRLKHENYT